mmetsp:Transcript_20363/g.49888  ORF Transcript_20363/g.49888 Transcript_20363/m.49888 type:complete len:459 (-) Transcript_20363:123-1499(-)
MDMATPPAASVPRSQPVPIKRHRPPPYEPLTGATATTPSHASPLALLTSAALAHSPSSAPPPASSLPPRSSAALQRFSALDDEHVTVWDPATGKTVAGNAAPYRRNLAVWLAAHPGWVEKADELKSSKRRSAGRRARAAAQAFASLCGYQPVVGPLIGAVEAAAAVAAPERDDANDWSPDEYVRLEEALVKLGHEIHAGSANADTAVWWDTVAAAMGPNRPRDEVVHRCKAVLHQGVETLAAVSAGGVEAGSPVDVPVFPTLAAGSPASLSSLGSSTTMLFERAFRSPREPRVTVWEPSTGRTISGNAAPCRKNLTAWIDAHPGWEAKPEEHLSSARRAVRMAAADGGGARGGGGATAAMAIHMASSAPARCGSLAAAMAAARGGEATTPSSEGDALEALMQLREPSGMAVPRGARMEEGSSVSSTLSAVDGEDDDDDDHRATSHVHADDVENAMEMD